MSIFSDKPGARERHLQRQYQNDLFGNPEITPEQIIFAQQQDEEDVQNFMNDFRDLVQQAVDLKPNADAELVLKIKEQLDKYYEKCAGLSGDQREIKTMISRLVRMLMQAMWASIGNDRQAHSKLEMEDNARASHIEMLEEPLIADLLNPNSLIKEDQLVPTLLTESAQALQKAMHIFTPEQQINLYQQARRAIQNLDNSTRVYAQAQQRLTEMERMIQADGTLN